MSGDSAASSPGRTGARAERPVGRKTSGSRWGRFFEGGLLQGGVQGSPVLRLFMRWVRRPLLPVMRLWRRNIQLKVVVTTLLMSLGVVLLLGFVVIGQVRNGLLDAKVKASQSQATGGFSVAKQKADAAVSAGGDDAAGTDGRSNQNVSQWMGDLVESLSSGGQGAFDVVTLPVSGDSGGRGPRASGNVFPTTSVPQDLRDRVDSSPLPAQSYTRIVYTDGQESQPALIIGKQVNDPNNEPYQLYYLFPLTQEEKSLSLVKGTLATAGLFVVVLLGAIAWLVVRQVVTPVRMAAGIAERLSAGRLQERMKVTGEDDIARLGEAFNKMAQNLQLKIQQLEDLSRMQRRFVSDVSHELRTPLTTVRMAADVIHDAREDFDPVTARSAELLADQLDRFESLLADLLEISRFDAGAAALEAEPIDLRVVVQRVVSGAAPLAERKGTRIRLVGDQQPVVAEADARRVERVLRNLVVNAVEHGEGKDVLVKLASAGGAVAVAVRDYGVGLKPGEATRVFSRFWRADPARARTTGGTGLGLSIALEDARLHGGWLQAWGEPGGGSQFRLTLPRTADEPLRGSPIPLEPKDSRRNRGLNDAGLPRAGDGEKRATVPVQTSSEPTPLAPRVSAAPTADPTALPGNGARVVPRPTGGARPTDDTGAAGSPPSDARNAGPEDRNKQGRQVVGADRVGGGRRGPVRTVVSVACGAVLLAGCASMPDSGDLRGVESTPRQDSQVRVYALLPRENAEAPEIVDGFLEALTSDDPDFETARKYLTDDVARTWKPEASLTVLADGPDSSEERLSGGEKSPSAAEFVLTGKKVATVDAQQVYAPAGGQYKMLLHLVREKKSKQWRIDSPPPGVVMGKSDFLRNYTSVNRYYFASNSSTESDGQPVAVADPVYVRKKVDPMTQTVSLLLAGPSRWLNPVVRSSFPTGTALKKGVTQLTPDDQNRLTVPLNAKADRVGSKKCQEMAAQLLFTLRDLTPTGVSSVDLQRSDGTQLCDPVDENSAENTVVHEIAKDGYQYFIDGKHRLVRLAGASTDPEAFAAVPGALGEGEKELRSAAVSRDERKAAGVSLDGSALYVGSLVSGASLGEPVLHSEGKTQNDRLTTPSWDGEGDLWVADRDPDHPRLLLLKKGAGEPIEVDTTGLDGRIDAVRMAADGVRIALIVEKGGEKSLVVGRIERGDKASGEKAIAVVEPRSVAPQLVEVTAMSWAGDSRLVVVGREDRGVQQMAYVQVDGSTPVGSAPAALTGVKALASSEDEQQPLMAYSEEDGIVRLLSGAKWQQVVKDGTAPVYPG